MTTPPTSPPALGRPDLESLLTRSCGRATCPTRPAGAVLLHPARYVVISTGYEGAPFGLGHCDVLGCQLDGDGVCARAVPAELNALLLAARDGWAVHGAVLALSHPPRMTSVGAIINAGVSRVVCAHTLPPDVEAMLTAARVSVGTTLA